MSAPGPNTGEAPRSSAFMLLAGAVLGGLVCSVVECLDLQLIQRVKLARPLHVGLLWATHATIMVATALTLAVGFDTAIRVLAAALRRLWPRARSEAIATRVTLSLFLLSTSLVGCLLSLIGATPRRASVVGCFIVAPAVAFVVGACAPWRHSPYRRRTHALLALACLAGVLALHVFNYAWCAKTVVLLHLAATTWSLALALFGACFAVRAILGDRSFRLPRFGLAIAVVAAIPLAVALLGASNDVRHLLFNRAYDVRGILFVGFKPSRSHLKPGRFAVQPPFEQAPLGGSPRVERVVLITIDTLRADHLPVYGYTRNTAPALTALAREGVVFERAWAAAGSTLLSLDAILASDGRAPRLVAHLAGANVGRRAIVSAELARYLEPRRLAAFDEVIKTPSKEDAALAEAAERFVTDRPFEGFLWIHLAAPHAPYDRHGQAGFGDADVDRYDGEILEADRAVGRILAALDARGLTETTAVIVSSDHGEEFGEHGGRTHGWDVYDELLHVPLILRLPGAQPRRVSGHVGHVDLSPTICDLFGVPASDLPGISLVPAALGRHTLEARQLVTGPNEPFYVGALLSGPWKLTYSLWSASFGLFDLAHDPAEQLNLFESRRDIAEPLVRTLREGLTTVQASR